MKSIVCLFAVTLSFGAFAEIYNCSGSGASVIVSDNPLTIEVNTERGRTVVSNVQFSDGFKMVFSGATSQTAEGINSISLSVDDYGVSKDESVPGEIALSGRHEGSRDLALNCTRGATPLP